MRLSQIPYILIIGPLEILFELVFMAVYKVAEDPGSSIVFLSLFMNLLLLPLYKRTDEIQAGAMHKEKKMQPYLTHIRKTFHGNEQFMMIRTLYRQNHYKPWDSLKGLTPLILEIPFFMAAYGFLSRLDLLKGASLGPIGDLTAPDGLLVLGTVEINALPILMTVINLLSGALYTRNAPRKMKFQLFFMAFLFLCCSMTARQGLSSTGRSIIFSASQKTCFRNSRIP